MSDAAALVAAVTWPLALYLIGKRFAAVLERFAPPVPEPNPYDTSVPEDIIAYIASHQDAWAQEDVTRVVQEKYAELKSWNRVRRALDLAEAPGE